MTRRKHARAMGKEWTMPKVIGVGILLIVVGWGIWSGAFVNMWNQYSPEPYRVAPDGFDNAEQVDLSIDTYHMLDKGDPAATPIRVYDANMNFIESASTSSGVATFSAAYWEGETIYLQARATAPSSATYVTYTTPLMKYVVPQGDVNGDAQLPSLGLWETSTSVIVYNITDQGGNKVYLEASEYHVNTTDTQLNVLVTITSDCAYGTPEDFTDMDTGKHYLSGAWLVVKSTATQSGLTGYVAHFYSSSLEYYVFNMPMIVYDADLGYQTANTFTLADGTTGFTASADFDFDMYDTCWANSFGDISASSFMNGDSDLNPFAITSSVE